MAGGPLDGTREFIRRSDQFTINIALIHNHEAVFGLILSPVDGVCYHAWRGGGAYKRPRNQPVRRIQVARACQPSIRSPPARHPTAAGVYRSTCNSSAITATCSWAAP